MERSQSCRYHQSMGGKGGVKYNRFFGKRGRGGRGSENSAATREPRDDRDEFEIHDGSFKLEELKTLPEWEKRVVQPSCSVKRKYAVCFGYLGSRYQGLQINADAETIEKMLEKALLLAGGISEENFGNIHKISWSRTARTDKGVHALSQCCAMKLNFPLGHEEEFRKAANSFLPEDIQIHYIQKVAKTFNGKFCCSGRRYHYLLPTYLLSEEKAINKLMNEAQLLDKDGSSDGQAFLRDDQLQSIRDKHLKDYRAHPEAIEKLKIAASQYVGTHNYHNFTSAKEGGDASAIRYITKFEVTDPFIDNNDRLEWVCLVICGQSFLLNQIRKMVTLAIEFARGKASLVSFERAFDPKLKVDIPMAPGLGLYLNQLFFQKYNYKIIAHEKIMQDAKLKREKKAMEKKQKEQTEELSSSSLCSTDGDDDTMKRHEEVDEPNLAIKKQKNDAGEVINTKNVDKDAIDENGEEHELVVHSPIEWASHTKVREDLEKFEMEVIQPHIIVKEYNSLAFIGFMDYLRVKKCSYPLE